MNLIYTAADIRVFKDDDSRQDVIELKLPKGANQQVVIYLAFPLIDQLTKQVVETRHGSYSWKVGDVFTNGTNRWKVDSVVGDKAILRSCTSLWATTVPLTYAEWQNNCKWFLERP